MCFQVASWWRIGRTKHRLWCSAGAQQGGETQVADLDHPLRTIDEDVVTLEISVDNGRVVAVQVYQAAENLPSPALQNLVINNLVPLAVPASTGVFPVRFFS